MHLLSPCLHTDLSLHCAKDSVEGKLHKSEVPAVRLEAFDAEDPLLREQTHHKQTAYLPVWRKLIEYTDTYMYTGRNACFVCPITE